MKNSNIAQNKNEKNTKTNYFEIQDIEDKDYQQISSPSKNIDSPSKSNADGIKTKQSPRRQHRKNIKLQPYTQVDLHRIEIEKKDEKCNYILNPEKQVKKKQEKQNKRANFFIESSQEQDKEEKAKMTKKNQQQQAKGQETTINKVKQKPRSRVQKLNFSEDEDVMQQNSPTQNKKQLQKKKAVEKVEKKNTEPAVKKNNQNTVQDSSQNSQQGDQAIQHEQHPNNIRRTVSPPLKMPQATVFTIKRDNEWLNRFWPQFNIHYQSNNLYFLSAKLTGNNSATTFTMSKNRDDFVQNGPNYAGKVKASFIGNIISVYGPGYNPSDAKSKNLPLRNMLATVEYQTNFFGTTRPRNFRAYVLKPGINYYDDLQGTNQGQQEIPLNLLYSKPINKDKIIVLINRKAEWNEDLKGYMLNFGGRIKKPSIKNFILQEESNPQNVKLIFGKTDDNQYRLDVGKYIDPLVGFGIALSTFGGKIGCE